MIVVTTRPRQEIETLRLLWKSEMTGGVGDLNLLWIELASPEFNELFRLATEFDMTELPTDQPQLMSRYVDD